MSCWRARCRRGIIGWSLRGVARRRSGRPPPPPMDLGRGRRQVPARRACQRHVGIDHLVAMSPDLDRSVEVLHSAGLDLRRIREQPTPAGAPRQAFFRLGEAILELVQEPEEALAARGDGRTGRRASGGWRCSATISSRPVGDSASSQRDTGRGSGWATDRHAQALGGIGGPGCADEPPTRSIWAQLSLDACWAQRARTVPRLTN